MLVKWSYTQKWDSSSPTARPSLALLYLPLVTALRQSNRQEQFNAEHLPKQSMRSVQTNGHNDSNILVRLEMFNMTVITKQCLLKNHNSKISAIH